MDLSAYLLNEVVEATAPPNETEADARSRGDAIVEMVCAFDPRDAMETMIACHCVMLRFLLNAAIRDASNINLEAAVLTKARAGAVAMSRTLHQWTTQFEKARKRNETRGAEMREAVRTPPAAAVAVDPIETQSQLQKSREAPNSSALAPVASPANNLGASVPVLNARVAQAGGSVSAVATGALSNVQGKRESGGEGDRRRVA